MVAFRNKDLRKLTVVNTIESKSPSAVKTERGIIGDPVGTLYVIHVRFCQSQWHGRLTLTNDITDDIILEKTLLVTTLLFQVIALK